MRVVITGSRQWTDKNLMAAVLDGLLARYKDKLEIVHGHCRDGADALADQWCKARAIEPKRYPADWDQFGKKAGHIRNGLMINDEEPDLCVAFKDRFGLERHPDGRVKGGTEDCVARAKAKKVPVWLLQHA